MLGERNPSLTRRERQVAELLADGLTNQEIAEYLFISINTVRGHVAHIRARTGIRSRVHIAQWWREQEVIERTVEGSHQRRADVVAHFHRRKEDPPNSYFPNQ